MKIYYAGDTEHGKNFDDKAAEYAAIVKGHMVNQRSIVSFSPEDNVEIIVSVSSKDASANIVCVADETVELDLKNCIAVGSSYDDYRVFIVNDSGKYSQTMFGFGLPGQILMVRTDKHGVASSYLYPRVTIEELKSAIECDKLSKEREEFGKTVAFYYNVITDYLIRSNLMKRDEKIVAVGRLGE